MRFRKKITRTAAAVLSAAFIGMFAAAGYYSARLPSDLTAESGTSLAFAEYPEISCSADIAGELSPKSEQVTLSLFGAIPVKSVVLHEKQAQTLCVGGMPFGIKLLMEGVMVTKLGDIDCGGTPVCPARSCGIEVGDIICRADSQELTSNSQLEKVISESGGSEIVLDVSRKGKSFTVRLTPVYSEAAQEWRGGMWVRDSIAGIGTITFINKETGEFAALGHPVCDSDTGELIPVHSGEAVPVELSQAKKGEKGVPGELCGTFGGSSYGTLLLNNSCGIYGQLNQSACDTLCSGCEEYKLGYRQEIKKGKAQIISAVSGGVPKKYDIEIEEIDLGSSGSTRNMVIRITDDELISASGGIIQGMSGSPIIQNGKLIGAVTHVFVSDPTRGYAIFAENMAEYLS